MEDDGGLFNIEVSSADESAVESKVPRDHQSESEFQKQKREWRPKVEKGELWHSLDLPINNPTKPESQAIMHAVEELYFFRRYGEAAALVSLSLEGNLQDDFRKTLEDYLVKCCSRLEALKELSVKGRLKRLQGSNAADPIV